MLRSERDNVSDITKSDSQAIFKNIPDGLEWRIGAVKELIDVENNKLEISGFNSDEIQKILNWICMTGPS